MMWLRPCGLSHDCRPSRRPLRLASIVVRLGLLVAVLGQAASMMPSFGKSNGGQLFIIMEENFSPIMMHGAFVFAFGICGMMEASATCNPSTP